MKWPPQITTPGMISIVLAVAVLARLPLLNGSFWLDEAAQAIESTRPLAAQLSIAEDFQPPLLHLLLHGVAHFSHTEWWLRLFGALIPGIFSILFSYKIAKQWFSQEIALITATLLATSSFHIFYSQEIRPYMLSALWCSWSWWVLLENMKAQKWKVSAGMYYGLLSAFGLYTSYLYPFVILSQSCYVIWQERRSVKQYLLSLSFAACLFMPWLPYLWEQLQIGQQLRQDLPGWEVVVAIPQVKSLPLALGKFIFGVLNIDISATFLAITAIIFASLGWNTWKSGKIVFTHKKMRLLFCWFFIPLFTAWFVSFFIPILQPKRVIYLLPALYLGIAALSLEWVKYEQKKSKNWIKYLPIAVILAINIFSTLSYYTKPEYQRENWRFVYQKINQEYPTNSAVIFAFPNVFAPWRWYDTNNYPVVTTGSLTTTDTAALEFELKKASRYSYLLVFDYLRDLTDPGQKIDGVLQGLGYKQKDLFSVPNIGFIRVYARSDGVLS